MISFEKSGENLEKTTLQFLVNRYFGETQTSCKFCNKGLIKETKIINNLPEVLVIYLDSPDSQDYSVDQLNSFKIEKKNHVKRKVGSKFYYQKEIKIEPQGDFKAIPRVLDNIQPGNTLKVGGVLYHIVSVSYHTGTSRDRGHWYSKSINGKDIYLFDDEKVVKDKNNLQKYPNLIYLTKVSYF
jgi:ubiquitin C-terminal hydrolase